LRENNLTAGAVGKIRSGQGRGRDALTAANPDWQNFIPSGKIAAILPIGKNSKVV
jgi:hypothetical protein